MTDKIRAGTLRGIVMRAPDITATRDFYLEQWGLHLAHEEDGITYLRGTGSEPFIYGLKDDDTYGTTSIILKCVSFDKEHKRYSYCGTDLFYDQPNIID